MERYLAQCLDSLLVANLNLAEIIIINDGSHDRTSAIAKQYMQKYPDCIRVIDKENGNYGSCINRGIKEATGKYIKILDADDSFYKENFGEFLSFLENIDADLVVSNFKTVDASGKIIKEVNFDDGSASKTVNFDKFVESTELSNLQMHGVAYLTSNLLALDYYQIEGISYTDQEWMFMPMSRVQKVAYFNKPLYRYLIGRAEQTMMAPPTKHVPPLIRIIKRMVDQYNNITENHQISKSHLFYLQERIKFNILTIYKEVILYSYYPELNNEIAALDVHLKQNMPDLWNKISDDTIKKNFPFKYINNWRKNNYRLTTLSLKTVRSLLRIYHLK